MTRQTQREQVLRVDRDGAGSRLDVFLSRKLELSRRTAIRMAEHCWVNSRPAPKGLRLAYGDEVRIDPGPPIEPSAEQSPELLRLEAGTLALAKPSGLPSVALSGRPGNCVASWLRRHYPECSGIGGPGEDGLVHRLDTATSGVMLVARSAATHSALRQQFHEHAVHKTYQALVAGVVGNSIEIDVAIGQHKKSRTRMRALADPSLPRYAATAAHTSVRPLRYFDDATLVEAQTRTGARHQIRVHLAHAGYPLIADLRYGGPPSACIETHLLHAQSISWIDPLEHTPRSISAPPPPSWEATLHLLGRKSER